MEKFRKQKTIDSFCPKQADNKRFDLPLARYVRKNKASSVLFSKYGQTDNFSTSNLELHHLKSDKQPDYLNLDGFLRYRQRMPVWYALKNRANIYSELKRRYQNPKAYLETLWQNPFQEMSMVKMWNVSIVGALIFGMFIMTFIYRYLGQNAAAGERLANETEITRIVEAPETVGMVLGESRQEQKDEKRKDVEDHVSKIKSEYKKESSMRDNLTEMVKGYPIQKMIPNIVKEDQLVASFLVAIAKKESNWGKRVPVLDGKDCYNYWGFRAKRERMGTGGHTCFDSREDAVKTVSKRIRNIIEKENIRTPEEMVVVWKCGYDCSWDNPAAVKKWVTDVKGYFDDLNKLEK
jgi:hypothetical protein